jgi:sirohydrochlorin cobaltochelatase
MGADLPVVCLAHGSRHPRSDAAVVDIAHAVAADTGWEVHASYLDFSPLTPTEVARLLAVSGHREAVVVPLLFTRAFHMGQDVPRALAEATAETGVTLRLADGIGTGNDLADLLAARVVEQVDEVLLYSVGSSVPGANDTVSGLAARVGQRLGVPGRAQVATGGSGTGPDALVDLIAERQCDGVDRIAVVPLFVSPGTLWDLAVRAVADIPGVVLGEPLVTDIAPIVIDRAKNTREDPK